MIALNDCHPQVPAHHDTGKFKTERKYRIILQAFYMVQLFSLSTHCKASESSSLRYIQLSATAIFAARIV